MGKRLTYTPNSKIRAALRQVWLRSRERAQCLKDHHYTCEICGRKQSVAKGKEVKIEVHHIHGIDWTDIIQLIREKIMQTPDRLIPLCKECHKKLHDEEKAELKAKKKKTKKAQELINNLF